MKGLLTLYVENDNWQEAFIIAQNNKDFMETLKLPYAQYLCKVERYEEALKVYKSCNRLDLSEKMLQLMAHNASKEARYKDTAKLFWQFATEHLSYVKNA